MDKGYRFVTDCIGSTYEAISALKETEQPISRRTFREYVGPEEWKDLQQRLGYEAGQVHPARSGMGR